jgi:Helicase conserved C-terminal domain
MRAKVEPLLASLRRRVRSPVADPAWYWAALLLLDEDTDALRAFLVRLGKDHVPASANPAGEELKGDEAERLTGFAVHARRALEVLDESAELGEFPPDLADVLVDFALGSAAIAWARTLAGFQVEDRARRRLAAQLGEAFRSLFNQPTVIRMLQHGDSARYWQTTLRYATDGNLQAVLDEYAHLLWEPAAWAQKHPDDIAVDITRAASSAITTKTSSVRPDYYRSTPERIAAASDGFALRTHFALRYGGARSGDDAREVREDAVRDAFKSPFYPFVLASTSVGQEGLDFHPWCHSVWHWNLPGNPVDLEQREGRVHRYKGHAIRKNVADRHGRELLRTWTPGCDPWQALFRIAEQGRAPGESELVPWWLAPGVHQVERFVPVLPLSREVAQLERLKRSLAIYRVAFGQPRQAELVEFLAGASISIEEMDSWVVRLVPGSADGATAPRQYTTAETFKTRREGHPETEITLDQYWALPEPELTETSLFIGHWTRPCRFIGDSSDIRVMPSAEQLAARAAAKRE